MPPKASMEAVLDLIAQITAWVPPASGADPIPYLERFLQVLPAQRAAPPIDRSKGRGPYRLPAFLRSAFVRAQVHQPKLVHMVSNVDDWRLLEQKG